MSSRNSYPGRSGCGLFAGGCGAQIGCVVLCNLVFGLWSVQYCLESFFNKHADPIVAFIAGLFVAELTFPLAIICWLVRSCGVPIPFIHH